MTRTAYPADLSLGFCAFYVFVLSVFSYSSVCKAILDFRLKSSCFPSVLAFHDEGHFSTTMACSPATVHLLLGLLKAFRASLYYLTVTCPCVLLSHDPSLHAFLYSTVRCPCQSHFPAPTLASSSWLYPGVLVNLPPVPSSLLDHFLLVHDHLSTTFFLHIVLILYFVFSSTYLLN